jgi:hypothetical protein
MIGLGTRFAAVRKIVLFSDDCGSLQCGRDSGCFFRRGCRLLELFNRRCVKLVPWRPDSLGVQPKEGGHGAFLKSRLHLASSIITGFLEAKSFSVHRISRSNKSCAGCNELADPGPLSYRNFPMFDAVNQPGNG